MWPEAAGPQRRPADVRPVGLASATDPPVVLWQSGLSTVLLANETSLQKPIGRLPEPLCGRRGHGLLKVTGSLRHLRDSCLPPSGGPGSVRRPVPSRVACEHDRTSLCANLCLGSVAAPHLELSLLLPFCFLSSPSKSGPGPHTWAFGRRCAAEGVSPSRHCPVARASAMNCLVAPGLQPRPHYGRHGAALSLRRRVADRPWLTCMWSCDSTRRGGGTGWPLWDRPVQRRGSTSPRLLHLPAKCSGYQPSVPAPRPLPVGALPGASPVPVGPAGGPARPLPPPQQPSVVQGHHPFLRQFGAHSDLEQQHPRFLYFQCHFLKEPDNLKLI